MDCRTIKDLIESGSKNGAGRALGKEAKRHIQRCKICRGKYAVLLDSGTFDSKIRPEPAELKGLNPLNDDPSDQFPDIADPVEFKDEPITFLLIQDGREEEIKMVEPQFDYPLPVGGRLVVRQKEDLLTDVIFRFDPEDERPYELLFTVRGGKSYAEPLVRKYGASEINDGKSYSAGYTERIIEKGGVKAWLEMKRGKARIYLRYTPQPR
jgi:hypothetical protein